MPRDQLAVRDFSGGTGMVSGAERLLLLRRGGGGRGRRGGGSETCLTDLLLLVRRVPDKGDQASGDVN